MMNWIISLYQTLGETLSIFEAYFELTLEKLGDSESICELSKRILDAIESNKALSINLKPYFSLQNYLKNLFNNDFMKITGLKSSGEEMYHLLFF
jgi:hypothetical protein